MGRTLVLSTALLTLVGAGCVRTPDARVLNAIAKAQSGVVAVATQQEGTPGNVTLCSGALVAPNLVLTARHCVSRAITTTPSCDADGRSHNGAHVSEDADPASIAIYSGDAVRVDRDLPRARAVRTYRPAGNVLCNADVAFLVLDRPILDVPVLPLRLESPVESGDEVLPVGFGGGDANVIGTRKARTHSPVLAVGPASNDSTGAVLGPSEFEVEVATCRGDSGGPAFDLRTGEVVGVISRGGSCTAKGNHVYTRVDAYARLATVAFKAASKASQESLAQRPE
ncbi:MAG: S1 family peptidase [Polyangiaceae bacterium]